MKIYGMVEYINTRRKDGEMERYLKALENAGLKITKSEDGSYVAEAKTRRGTLIVYLGLDCNAWVAKPNGTHKYLVEKSPAQIAGIIKQILHFNK